MSRILPFFILLFAIVLLNCTKPESTKPEWCNQLPREANTKLKKTDFSNYWFEVYQVDDSVYAIYEPYQWQEVISYLIIGNEFALLFDTGNGIGNIKQVVEEITSLPIRVLNSHSHLDHVGGNADFDFIYGLDDPFTSIRKKGLPHEQVAEEVSREALCKRLPDGFDPETYHIRPYEINEYVSQGYTIDIGNRILEIIRIPGHTSDGIGLLDKANGLLWTGDTFYQGTVWLFAKEINLEDYKKSIQRLADLSPSLRYLMPAHNIPLVDPKLLVEFNDALDTIERGEAIGTDSTNGRVNYSFKNFTILMNKN